MSSNVSPFNLGRKFNKNGELTAQWWSQDSLDAFNAKAKCVENQYSMYKVRDKYPVSQHFLRSGKKCRKTERIKFEC